jgi:murein DD-endopeptidase MepM/ murein hydrolase activator NlpD
MILAQKIAGRLRDFVIRHRVPAALIVIPCFGGVAAFGIAPDTMVERVQINNVVEQLELSALVPAYDEAATYVREERIQRGDTVASLFARLQISDAEALQLVRTNRQVRGLHQLVPGRTVRATTTADGKLIGLRYLNGGILLSLDRSDAGFIVKEEEAQVERRLLMKAADIKLSLFGASDAAGMSDAIAMQVADIFSTDIDFHRDLRKGDRFSVAYEVFYHHGEPVKTGRVLAAEFVNQGKTYQAVYFDYAQNEGGYYTLDGRNLRKQFLRSPLEFSRITSGFSLSRLHPILQSWRSHKGIDYGAPTGTRVKATGDGVVDFVGSQGGYGNVVVLRHQSKYTTWYGHLSGFAKGLRKGKRVSQGEVIAYVGATGLATGPHLHYEFRINDVHQNPLRVAMPEAPPITPELKPRFEQTAAPRAQELAMLRNTVYVRLD